jgi:AcrR family transcriptional regulator
VGEPAARPPKRTRRGPSENQELLLKAANRLFSEQGYHGTTTKHLAEEAGVGEPVLFRHFGSKAGLFEAAILKPFTEFVSEWADSWDRRPPASTDAEVITRSFVEGFYTVVDDHRELLWTLIAARAQGGDKELGRIAAEVSDRFADELRVMRRTVLQHGEPRDYKNLDPPLTVAVASGAVMSVLLFEDWLFPRHEGRPSRAKRIDELTAMLLHGIAHRG